MYNLGLSKVESQKEEGVKKSYNFVNIVKIVKYSRSKCYVIC